MAPNVAPPQSNPQKANQSVRLEIIYEDADLLVVHKPADLVCHPTKGDDYSSLISRARIYLRSAAIPHLVHRLDRETSGLVVIAKTPLAARELGKIWETRAVRKEYLAIVHGHVTADQGLIDAPLGKDETSRVAIKDCVRRDGHPAQTQYFVEQRFSVAVKVSSQPIVDGEPPRPAAAPWHHEPCGRSAEHRLGQLASNRIQPVSDAGWLG